MPVATHLTDGGVANNLGDFFLNKWLPFAVANCGFVANRYAGAALTLPDAEILTHKGTVGSPTGPFMFIHVENNGAGLDHAFIMTGTGVDTARPAFDQPGNPGTGPNSTVYSVAGLNIERNAVNIVGPCDSSAFAGHYLFAPADGSYCYAAIQVAGGSTPDFRHFWVGDLSKEVDFSGDAWFFHSHQVLQGTNSHAPYINDPQNIHPLQIGNQAASPNANGGSLARYPTLYAPDLRTDADFYGASSLAETGALIHNSPSGVQAGKINNVTGYDRWGYGACLGGGSTKGGDLFYLDANLSAKARPLIPLRWHVQFDFSGTWRWAPVGSLPDVFRINMQGFDINEQLSLGGVNYRVFPLRNHIPGNINEPYSGFEGFAYREIP